MKVLVLCERVDDQGGTETYLRTVLPALKAHGDEVRVLARSIAVPDAYGVPADGIAWSDEHDPPSPQARDAVAQIAREFRADVAVAHNVLDAGVLDAAATASARFVYHLHDHRPFCPNGDRLYPQGGSICSVAMSAASCGFHSLVHGCVYGPRLRTLELVRLREDVATIVRHANATVAFSNYVGSLALRNRVPRDRTVILQPPLPDAAFAGGPPPRPAVDSVLFAGRVVPSKGARSLVRALARITRRRPLLRIAGDGPDLAKATALAAALGVRTEMHGRLGAATLRRAYDEATLVALPSMWGEPFGLVGIEAFARGRPVVGYDSGAIGEWLTRGTGRLVPRGDERGLASAIVELLAPAAWARASAQAFAASQVYRLNAHVTRLRAVYEREGS